MSSHSGVPRTEGLEFLFGTAKYVIGMVHLLPLPGSPRWAGQMTDVLERALVDARALEEGGVEGVIVENFGDVPFAKGRVEPHTVSAMTLAVQAVGGVVSIPVGVNVLRNDARSALAIACVTGASFIRVNVHTGAMITDQGLIEGNADETMRYRRELGTNTMVFADVLVKHAVPLGDQDMEQAAKDTVFRGLADAIIVTGTGTGEVASLEDVAGAREAVIGFPILVGSGVDEGNIAELMSLADGVIVGTSLKKDGVTTNPVDVTRVKRLMALVDQLR